MVRVCYSAVWDVGGGEDINDGLHGGLLRMVVVGLGLPVRVVVTTPRWRRFGPAVRRCPTAAELGLAAAVAPQEVRSSALR